MKQLVIGGVVIAGAIAAWQWTSSSPSSETTATATDRKLVLDRLWIDHIPRNERDPVKVFVALTEQPVGLFQTASMWKGEYELFQFEMLGNEIRAVFPQSRDKEKFSATGTRCNEGGMDYCLELSGSSRGAKKYYSRKGWEIDGALDRDAINAKVESLVHGTTDVE